MDCSLPDFSVHGFLQARVLEWVAIFLLQGIFLTQGLNPGLLHWQEGSLPLVPPGKPLYTLQLDEEPETPRATREVSGVPFLRQDEA